MTKKCWKCKETKSLLDFPKCRTKKSGINNTCKLCANAISREYCKKHRERYVKLNRLNRAKVREWVFNYKTGKCCKICGESRTPCLDFHHKVPSDKKFLISQNIGRCSLEKLKEEIDKCDILCANCHRVIHADTTGNPLYPKNLLV